MIKSFNMRLKLLSLFLFFQMSQGITQIKMHEVHLFNGYDLEGWQTVNPKFMEMWSVQDSSIVCGDGIAHIPKNTYLHTQKEYHNFELTCLFKITGDPSTGLINSGIQYRSQVVDGKMIGYQADIGDGYWGDLYDEHRRGLLAGGQRAVLNLVLNKNGWNTYRIKVVGPRHQLYINGVKTVEYWEENEEIPDTGVISVQNHSGGNSKVEFRNITVVEFPD